jgi:hypothetical protein
MSKILSTAALVATTAAMVSLGTTAASAKPASTGCSTVAVKVNVSAAPAQWQAGLLTQAKEYIETRVHATGINFTYGGKTTGSPKPEVLRPGHTLNAATVTWIDNGHDTPDNAAWAKSWAPLNNKVTGYCQTISASKASNVTVRKLIDKAGDTQLAHLLQVSGVGNEESKGFNRLSSGTLRTTGEKNRLIVYLRNKAGVTHSVKMYIGADEAATWTKTVKSLKLHTTVARRAV